MKEVTQESKADVKRKVEDEEVKEEDKDTKRRRLNKISKQERIKESAMNVVKQIRQIESSNANNKLDKAKPKGLMRMGALSSILCALDKDSTVKEANTPKSCESPWGNTKRFENIGGKRTSCDKIVKRQKVVKI